MEKKVVFGAYFDWHSYLHIGSHQYAKQFARNGYKVAYISDFISPLHCIFARHRDTLNEKFNSWRKGGDWVEDGKIWAYVPFTFLPPVSNSMLGNAYTIQNSHYFTFPPFEKMLERNGFKESEIIFLDEVLMGYLLDTVIHRKSILRIHDDISFLLDKKYRSPLKAAIKTIRNVDLVVVVSRAFEAFVREAGAKRILYLPNGADFGHFACGSDSLSLPEEYKNIPSPRVIYVGSIKYWIDIDLLAYAASRLPDYSFVFIGRPMTDLSKIASFPNVYIIGERNYSALPKYLKNAEIGIIPFNPDVPITTTIDSPLKLYEYMASGLPVVSTRWQRIEKMNSPAYLAEDYEDFTRLIEKAIGEKGSSKYIEFAKTNSWEERFKVLIDTLYA